MKQIIILIITLTLVSCNNSKRTEESKDTDTVEVAQDTVIVKIKNKIDRSYGIGFYTKSYTYCWIKGNDTLDFKIGVTEHLKDSSVQINVFNQKPILFSTTLDKINEGLPLIRENFELENLSSIYFGPPILYKDLTTELSQNYKIKFDQKNISYEQLNEFLKESWLEQKIGNFLHQFNKTTKRYGIEKFQLLEKQYYNEYIPNSDLNEYPEFSIHGMGVSIIINE